MIEVEVETDAWTDAIDDVAVVVERAAAAALNGESGDVVVLLSDDATVQELNARFRDRDRPTNVLSFPAAAMPGQDPVPLGDIVLAYGVCAAEAAAQGKRLTDHLTHLVVHGLLHLLGRDHEDEAEAEAMEAEERAILARLGVADPYTLPHDA
ncbi:rRNA maturation RNase YbeY [Brevundimonas subvibrioides]|uniref:rRNA maturation RNase YbeY n=1 Tax=Brevundimonas subvibrioides TaxID=74313 RepID=UPI0022B2F216|nr:rRNA maturation RNase YbeY [Brevundimonas subvibrioides]